MRRLPAWATLLPLALLLFAYWRWWDGRAAAFRADLARAVPGITATLGGFPYRLSAAAGAARRVWTGGGTVLTVGAARWQAERQPWRDGLTVLGAERPRVRLSATSLPAFAVDAATGRASLNAPGRRVSAEFASARVAAPSVLPPFTADRFELHVREPVGARAGQGPAAERAQLYARGEGVRLSPEGAPLTLALAASLTSPRPLVDVTAWREGGALRVTEVTLGAAKLPALATLTATVTPAPDRLFVEGTLTTVCPRQFAALLGGPPAPRPEYRARRPVTLRIAGPLGAPRLTQPLPAVLPVRAREAPCPSLTSSSFRA